MEKSGELSAARAKSVELSVLGLCIQARKRGMNRNKPVRNVAIVYLETFLVVSVVIKGWYQGFLSIAN